MMELSKQILRDPKSQNKYAGRDGLIYVRVSSKKQETEGHGRESQEERCRQYLRSIGLDVDTVKIFPDTFTGGGDFIKRPAMRALLSYIDANPHKKFVVVFDDLKRFARDTTFHLKLRTEFRVRDILPHCLNYNFDDSPEGMFVETVLAAGNELERHQNKRQVIQKMTARLESGYYCFRHKRWYDMVKDSVHGRILVPNKDAPVLKQALEGFATGVFVRQIDVARFLHSKGFWKNRTVEAHLTDTSDILRDPIYCGQIEYPRWEIARRPGKHKAIISLETFERIQKRLYKENGGRIRQDISPDFPLRGLIICPECKEKLTAAKCRSRTKKLHYYYYCVRKDCPLRSKSIRKDDLEENFRNLVKQNSLKEKVASFIAPLYNRIWEQEVADHKANKATMEKLRKDKEQEIRDLTDLCRQARSDLVRAQYEQRIEEIAMTLQTANEVPQNHKFEIPFRTACSKFVSFLKNPLFIWDSVDVLEQHRLFFFLFDGLLTYSKTEGFRTGNLLSSVRIFETFSLNDSDDVDISIKTSNQLITYISRFGEYYQSSPALQNSLN